MAITLDARRHGKGTIADGIDRLGSLSCERQGQARR